MEGSAQSAANKSASRDVVYNGESSGVACDSSDGIPKLTIALGDPLCEIPDKQSISGQHVAGPNSSTYGCRNTRHKSHKRTWILFWMCWYCTLQGMVISGLVPSVLSTLERRFNFRALALGRIMQSYDIAYAVFCTPVAYFGSRYSKPLFLGVGLIVMALGSFVFSIPHLISDRSHIDRSTRSELSYCNMSLLNPSGVSFNGSWQSMCGPSCANEGTSPSNAFHTSHGSTSFTSSFEEAAASRRPQLETDNGHYEQLFALAHIFHGIGSAPLFTLGVSYIDEIVDSALSSLYIAIFYTCVIFGPAVGFFLSSGFLRVHSDFLFAQRNEIILDTYDEADPEWVGAWWIGFQLAALLSLIAVIPILGFKQAKHQPTVLTNSKRTSRCRGSANAVASQTDGAEEQCIACVPSTALSERPTKCTTRLWNDLRHIPVACFKLLSSPSYMCITLAASFAGLLISGFGGFTAKYLERQFSVPTSKANLIIGCIMVPSAGVGTLFSGYIVKRFHLSRSATLKFCVFMELCSFILSPMFVFYCDPADFVNLQGNDLQLAEWPLLSNSLSVTPVASNCNEHCACKMNEFHPVCGSIHGSKVNFFSACFAGCPEAFKRTKRTYENCTCADGGSVTAGICESNCSSLILFLLLFVPMCFFTFSIGVPALSVILRTVDYNERALALGIQWIVIRCIGTIPAPTIFAWLFDVSCIVRYAVDGVPTGVEGGRCLIHSTKLLADLFLAFAVLGQFLTGGFLTLAVFFDRRVVTANSTEEPLEIVQSSVGMENGLTSDEEQVGQRATTSAH
ncbi:sodium independent organic anion transporter [Trichuris trichiura]|uniref:Solute carrier organic anion transporter family member n=1 Tax=Trichuris trichiura TaxID=36087 RepID=A0A077YX85_TRITR|nr:sodium independent organic anion transporter [Trichuris trichiura]